MKTESPTRFLLGLVTGGAFGALLQKGRAAKLEAITGQLQMRDQSVRRIMGTAVAVGAVGSQLLIWRGLAQPHVKPLNPVGVTVGAVLFGTGMAVLGYCPGTTVAAVGEGHRDAAVGLAGMLTGATAYVLAYPRLEPHVERGGKGKITLPELTGTNPWIWVAGLGGATLLDYALARASRV